jgi:hypothetical protein
MKTLVAVLLSLLTITTLFGAFKILKQIKKLPDEN